MDSSIIDRIVVVWLGGHAHSWQNTATHSHLVLTPYIESNPRYDIFHDGHYQYAFNQSRPLMRYVYQIDRDLIWEDLVKKLTQA